LAEPAAGPLEERIARAHLRLVQKQLGRLPLPYLLIDVFVAWLLVRAGLPWIGPLWLVLLLPAQLWRWLYVRRIIAHTPADPARVLRHLGLMLALLGLMRGALVPLLFSQPVRAEHYMFTMIYLGMLAGTGASVAGQARPFLTWAVLAPGALAAAWMLQGGTDGPWLGALIVSLVAVLTGHVRDQGQGLRDFVTLASDNERQAQRASPRRASSPPPATTCASRCTRCRSTPRPWNCWRAARPTPASAISARASTAPSTKATACSTACWTSPTSTPTRSARRWPTPTSRRCWAASARASLL
jgi:hypothetical protein